MSESGGVKLMRPSKGYGGEVDEKVWQRIEASMNFCEGDRVTIWDYIDNPAVVAHFRQEGDDYETAMVRVYHGLGIDLCRGYGSSFEPSQEGTSSAKAKGNAKLAVKRRGKSATKLRTLTNCASMSARLSPFRGIGFAPIGSLGLDSNSKNLRHSPSSFRDAVVASTTLMA